MTEYVINSTLSQNNDIIQCSDFCSGSACKLVHNLLLDNAAFAYFSIKYLLREYICIVISNLVKLSKTCENILAHASSILIF